MGTVLRAFASQRIDDIILLGCQFPYQACRFLAPVKSLENKTLDHHGSMSNRESGSRNTCWLLAKYTAAKDIAKHGWNFLSVAL